VGESDDKAINQREATALHVHALLMVQINSLLWWSVSAHVSS